ncbi:hypothetical protein ACJMK2_017487 [Sinanodonta woodiana]|uniref:WAP domain-containing protein n=1 Tax=Sinanodonta woodiana TaxID=1069815 RepID=A0ABD3UBV9_SINWO
MLRLLSLLSLQLIAESFSQGQFCQCRLGETCTLIRTCTQCPAAPTCVPAASFGQQGGDVPGSSLSWPGQGDFGPTVPQDPSFRFQQLEQQQFGSQAGSGFNSGTNPIWPLDLQGQGIPGQGSVDQGGVGMGWTGRGSGLQQTGSQQVPFRDQQGFGATAVDPLESITLNNNQGNQQVNAQNPNTPAGAGTNNNFAITMTPRADRTGSTSNILRDFFGTFYIFHPNNAEHGIRVNVTKSGYCRQRISTAEANFCLNLCYSDEQCPRNLKCCPSGCSLTCTEQNVDVALARQRAREIAERRAAPGQTQGQNQGAAAAAAQIGVQTQLTDPQCQGVRPCTQHAECPGQELCSSTACGQICQ